jgi:hypothetical protein
MFYKELVKYRINSDLTKRIVTSKRPNNLIKEVLYSAENSPMQSKAVLLAKNKFEKRYTILPCGVFLEPTIHMFFSNPDGLVQGENSIVKIKTNDKPFEEMLRNSNFPFLQQDMNKIMLQPDSGIVFEVFLFLFFLST